MAKWKLPVLILALFTGAGLIAADCLTAEDIPEEIEIYNEGYRKKLYEPVDFNHLEHVEDYDVACDQCHHDYKGGENIWKKGDPVKKCTQCHNPKKKQGEKVYRLVFAYHFNCKKCHQENDSGPTACEDCHTKRSPEK